MIKTISSKVIFKNKYGYELYEDKVQFESGEGIYNYIKLKSGFVAICAYDKDGVYLIRNFRYPIGKEIWELPKGYIGEGESPLAAAKRELLEETGFVAGAWKKNGEYQSIPGFGDMKCYFYMATDLKETISNTEDDEDISKCKKFKLDCVKSIDLLTNFAVSLLKLEV